MAFNLLPVELNEMIAGYIEDDKSLCAFAAVCRQTYAAVNTDRSSIWQQRFLDRYDPTEDQSWESLKLKYQARQTMINHPMKFENGDTERELRCLNMLRELITESCGEPDPTKYAPPDYTSLQKDVAKGKNLLQLRLFAFHSSNLLERIGLVEPRKNFTEGSILCVTVQLLLAHLAFDHQLEAPVRGFHQSQKIAYQDSDAWPIFEGEQRQIVNVEYLLHVCNFFRHHILLEGESLYRTFRGLGPMDKPKTWGGKLSQNPPMLEQNWTGSYSVLCDQDLDYFARGGGSREVLDAIDERTFQTMKFLSIPIESQTWEYYPYEHQATLDLTKPKEPEMTTVNWHKRSGEPEQAPFIRFALVGTDLFAGWYGEGRLYPLPPQQGIPGWQRIVFVKSFVGDEPDGGDPGPEYYEGCVLPGGRIIIGRWVTTDPSYHQRGPFIFWHTGDDPSPVLTRSDFEILADAGKDSEDDFMSTSSLKDM